MTLGSFAYSAPTIVWFAPDGLARLGSYLKRLGVARALVVTDAGVAASGALGLVREAAAGRAADAWTNVEPDAPRESVQAGAEAARALGADGIVAVGGGSAIDSGKAIALLAKHGGDVGRWDGNNKVGEHGLPLVAIPTTAGTGSEVSNIAVVKDTARARKLVIFDRAVYPDVAVLDPRLTVGLPAKLTAATGVDALTHAVEGVASRYAEPMCDAIGLACVGMVKRSLPRAVERGDDLDARGEMLIAASMAGQLVSMTFSGVAHAVAHALGVGFRVHHGTGNAVALPWSVRFNAEDARAAAQSARCAAAFGVAPQADDRATALAFADALEAFVASLGLATRLAGVGVGRADLPRVAELAFADPSHGPNPVKVESAATFETALASLL
ncbi:MAG TPA: iron-containing alcohol dehydrogenase [Minicystis sp.]|nr:iron-containing alcohol dehydrogenase [Minicystis sp.]